MKKWSLLIVLILLLAGCRTSPFQTNVEIDWVDFIKWNGKMYEGIYSGVIADEKFIGETIGKVKFKVADNIKDSSYKTKNGDAAFHEKGTVIYAIKENPNIIAVKSEDEINGYRLYYSRDEMAFKWHFKDAPLKEVTRVQIYQSNTPNSKKRMNELTSTKEVKSFLQLLENSKEDSSFQPNMEKGDPTSYDIVLYTNESIAYKYDLQFDGQTYFWHPWDVSIVSEEISRFIPIEE